MSGAVAIESNEQQLLILIFPYPYYLPGKLKKKYKLLNQNNVDERFIRRLVPSVYFT